ncbi:MAG: class I SAM-dependent methyltransferase [Rhizobiaceae bacterium]|nr:class I SAM-dependent methyltransferase [Rhizobiaceae bacterium]
MVRTTPFDFIQEATRQHRQRHRCGAYTFEDGAGLIALAKAEAPRRVVELGTALGFTACCLAFGTDDTMVDTVEGDPEHVMLARRYIAEAGLQDRVKVHQGDFHSVLPRLVGPYDLAFFDGFAPDDKLIWELCMLLRDGGVLVCANLGLAEASSRRALEHDLTDRSRWTKIATLEGGSTQVYRKLPEK